MRTQLQDTLRLTLSAGAVRRLYPEQTQRSLEEGLTVLGRRLLMPITEPSELRDLFPISIARRLRNLLVDPDKRIWLVSNPDEGASILITGRTPRP